MSKYLDTDWLLCPDECEDGFLYCLDCDSACDHDDVCGRCRGEGWVRPRTRFEFLLCRA